MLENPEQSRQSFWSFDGLSVMSTLGFSRQGGSLFALCLTRMILRFTSGATPTDCILASMTDNLHTCRHFHKHWCRFGHGFEPPTFCVTRTALYRHQNITWTGVSVVPRKWLYVLQLFILKKIFMKLNIDIKVEQCRKEHSWTICKGRNKETQSLKL